MFEKAKPFIAVIALGAVAACAHTPEPVGIAPTFDKYGNAYCPAGYGLSGDVCVPLKGKRMADDGNGGTGSGTDSGDNNGGDDNGGGGAGGGNQNQNNNQSQTGNQNQNENQNENQNQSG